MKNIKRILSLIIVMALLLTMMAVPAMAKDSDTNETDIIGSLYLSATPTTITVRGATGSYSFRIDDSTTWTTNATFSGLYPNTEHTVYAKTGSAPEITVGKITTKAADYVSNANATSIDATVTAKEASFLHNINFQNSLSLFFVVPQSTLSGYENVRFFVQRQHYEANATECTYIDRIIPLSECTTRAISGINYYQFTYENIAAAEMGEMIYVTIYAEKDGVTNIFTLDKSSVASYAYDRLSASSQASYRQLLVDLLNYGSAAQVHFHRNEANLVNASLTSAQKALANTAVTASTLVDCDNKAPELSSAAITLFNIQFVTTSNWLVMFNVDPSYNLSNITVKATYSTIKGVPKSLSFNSSQFKKNGSSYYVTIDSISVPDMGQPLSIDVYSGSTKISNTRINSMEAYCKSRLQNSTAETYKNLVLSLMRYSYSARAHFG